MSDGWYTDRRYFFFFRIFSVLLYSIAAGNDERSVWMMKSEKQLKMLGKNNSWNVKNMPKEWWLNATNNTVPSICLSFTVFSKSNHFNREHRVLDKRKFRVFMQSITIMKTERERKSSRMKIMADSKRKILMNNWPRLATAAATVDQS